MGSHLSAIGYDHIKTDQEYKSFVKQTILEIKDWNSLLLEKNKNLIEARKQAGAEIGLVIRAIRDKEKKENLLIGFNPYGQAHYETRLEKVQINTPPDSPLHIRIEGRETISGTWLSFQPNNILNYVGLAQQEQSPPIIEKAKIAGLAYRGIILPAFPIPIKEDSTKTEEFIQTKISQCTENNGTIDFIGKIIELKLLTNVYTQEKIYWVYIDTNPVRLEIYVNAKDLEGIPKIGTRIKGICWLQGEIII